VIFTDKAGENFADAKSPAPQEKSPIL